ncbi:hypothetical protein A9308_09550 [Moraxella atlantae]|uniref:Sulfatase N-terminal domain-containing protein n=1 Tax=Faucicola atlantae TaxID=34059 RepID=A0A1B8Q9R6_9GAMM|nr:hypothetical protein A9308_09550 [Moraxella atlantae]
MWGISQYYGLFRPWFNIDYLLLAVFFYRSHILNSLALFISLFVLFFIDILLLILHIFPFIQLNDLLYLSNFFFSAPALYKLLVYGLFIGFIILFFLMRDIATNKIILTKYQIGVILVVFMGLLALSELPWASKIFDSRLAFFITHRQASMLEATHGEVVTDLQSDYASKPLLGEIQNHQLKTNKILFIVNESWGETAKPEQQRAILQPIYQHINHLEYIQQGAFATLGATVTGEFRELCQKKLLVMDTKQIPQASFKQCLPNLLKQQGYSTYSVYGADKNLYSPDYWYPLAGLDQRYFVDDLPEGGHCKAFGGRCDVLLVPRIKKLLLAANKSFVYWMTLNTHAPYDDDLFIKGLDCEALGLKNDSHACGNYRLQYQFFSALSTLIADPSMHGVEVYVVGDHPPPMAEIRNNLKAFKNNEVAWLHFKIK